MFNFYSLKYSSLYRFLILNNYVINHTKIIESSFIKKLTELVNDLINRIEKLDDEDYTPVISFSSGNYRMYLYEDHY